ncbi:Imm10 family immunity protein [Shewanella putrefaciens]|uniref:Imm10 family immunity protein n=1 Tax=Shewanella putrefaciens TaxID=24 RepID=UPI0018E84374|nr:Imm10 family immunity protein [Shewanella putrefaciens]
MNYCFDATHIFTQDDGYMVMIGFADDELEPTKFVILQKAHEYDDQDKKMGMDKIHIQVADESRSKYGGINAVTIVEGVIRVSLSEDTKFALSIDGDIEAAVSREHPAFEEVKSQLKKICEEEQIAFSE